MKCGGATTEGCVPALAAKRERGFAPPRSLFSDTDDLQPLPNDRFSGPARAR
jgi:hypothetical protein